jgi:hypothetical protein
MLIRGRTRSTRILRMRPPQFTEPIPSTIQRNGFPICARSWESNEKKGPGECGGVSRRQGAAWSRIRHAPADGTFLTNLRQRRRRRTSRQTARIWRVFPFAALQSDRIARGEGKQQDHAGRAVHSPPSARGHRRALLPHASQQPRYRGMLGRSSRTCPRKTSSEFEGFHPCA